MKQQRVKLVWKLACNSENGSRTSCYLRSPSKRYSKDNQLSIQKNSRILDGSGTQVEALSLRLQREQFLFALTFQCNLSLPSINVEIRFDQRAHLIVKTYPLLSHCLRNCANRFNVSASFIRTSSTSKRYTHSRIGSQQ